MTNESESPQQKLCKSCGLCCNGTLFGFVTLEAGDDIVQLQSLGLTLEQRNDVLSFKQPCAAFRGHQCTIYANRPHVCRTFQCNLLRSVLAEQVSLDEAQMLVSKTVQQCEEVRNELQQVVGNTKDEPQTLRHLIQTFEALARDRASAGFRRQHGQLYLNYAALQLRLDRHFRHKQQKMMHDVDLKPELPLDQ